MAKRTRNENDILVPGAQKASDLPPRIESILQANACLAGLQSCPFEQAQT